MSIFMILLVVGLALPSISLLFSLLFGSMEGLMHLLHFDFGGADFHHDAAHDISHFGIITALLPFSPIIWCVQLAVMGCVGEMLYRAGRINIIAIWVIAVISGYTVMLIINNFIMIPLKKAKNFAVTTNDMIGQQVDVIETILENGVGAVRVVSKSGSSIYAAKSQSNERINQGEKVIIIEIKDGRAIVQHQ
ncbi:MAG: NfeD family protein [Firmicutes bacterium]|nr:NfeD family protein [Bacillota bacterium]